MNLKESFKKAYIQVVHDSNFTRVAPRSVSEPPGYASHRNVATCLHFAMQEVDRLTAPGTEATLERSIVSVSTIVMNAGVPVYYIPDAFATAVAATNMPGDLRGSDFMWPNQGLVLGLTEKFIKDYFGIDSAGYIYAANIKQGEHCVEEWLPRKVRMEVPFDKFGFFINRFMAEGITCHLGAYPTSELVKTVLTKDPYYDFTKGSPGEIKTNEQITLRIGAFIIKLLTILKINPAYVESGVMKSPERWNGLALVQREVWTPSFIGRAFRMQRAAGTGTSKKYHVRNGHITHQRMGVVDENFISATTIPRLPDKTVDGITERGEFDWSQVPEEIRVKFWNCHERRWVPPLEIGA